MVEKREKMPRKDHTFFPDHGALGFSRTDYIHAAFYQVESIYTTNISLTHNICTLLTLLLSEYDSFYQ